jgi:DNA primase
VSVPVSWDELAAGLDPAAFDFRTVPVRMAGLGADPWPDYDAAHQPLTDAMLAAVNAPHLP